MNKQVSTLHKNMFTCLMFAAMSYLCVYSVIDSSSYRGSTSSGLPGYKSFFESQELVLDVVDSRVILKKKVQHYCIST